MSEYSNEKLFYLQLNKNFFDKAFVKVIESQENGEKYLTFLLKMMCESISHNGYLRFNESIPYDAKMLAIITNTDIDVVRVALKLFEELGILKKTNNNSLFLPMIPGMTSCTTKGASKKQEQRDKKKVPQIEGGGQMSAECPPNVHHSNIYSNSHSYSNNQSNSNIQIDDEKNDKKSLDIEINEEELPF